MLHPLACGELAHTSRIHVRLHPSFKGHSSCQGEEGVHNQCINALLQPAPHFVFAWLARMRCRPTTWQPDANPNGFFLNAAEASGRGRSECNAEIGNVSQVSRLCDLTLEVREIVTETFGLHGCEVLKSQEMILRLRAPIKARRTGNIRNELAERPRYMATFTASSLI